MLAADGVDDGPVDGAVVVNGDVAKADGALEALRQVRREHAEAVQRVERGGHRVRRRFAPAFGDEMGSCVHAELHGARQVQRQDVLRVVVARERFDLLRALRLGAANAPAQ